MSTDTQLAVKSDTQLIVPAFTAPTLPQVVASAGFLTTLKQVEDQVAALVITDGQSAKAAANLLSRLTAAGKTLNDGRLALNRPFQDQIERINAAAKEPAARIDAAKATLNTAQTAFAVEQARLARDAEAARKKELASLEAQRAKEAEAARIAEAAAPPAPVAEDFDEPVKTETEKAIEAVRLAPVVAVPKPVGVTLKVTLFPHVEDVNKLPDVFVEKTAKLAAIRATFCTGWKDGDPIPVLAGCRFEVQRTTVSTGRSLF